MQGGEAIYRRFLWELFGGPRFKKVSKSGKVSYRRPDYPEELDGYQVSQQLTDAINQAIETLPERYRGVVNAIWDFETGRIRTPKEVAQSTYNMRKGTYGVEPETVTQIESHGFRILRLPYISREIIGAGNTGIIGYIIAKTHLSDTEFHEELKRRLLEDIVRLYYI